MIRNNLHDPAFALFAYGPLALGVLLLVAAFAVLIAGILRGRPQ